MELENLCADPLKVTSVVDILGENTDRNEKGAPLSLAPFSTRTLVFPLSIAPQERGSLDPPVNIILSFRGRSDNEHYASSSDMIEMELNLPSDSPPADSAPPKSGDRSSPSERSLATGYSSSKLRVCFEQRILFDDGDVGEYYWSTDSPTSRRAMYNKVRVYAGGKKIFSGYLNKKGCTRKLRRPEAKNMEIDYLTDGKVKGWKISVSGAGQTYRVKKRISKKSKAVVTINRTDARNVYMALKLQYIEPGRRSQIKAHAGDCSATAFYPSQELLKICDMAKGSATRSTPITSQKSSRSSTSWVISLTNFVRVFLREGTVPTTHQTRTSVIRRAMISTSSVPRAMAKTLRMRQLPQKSSAWQSEMGSLPSTPQRCLTALRKVKPAESMSEDSEPTIAEEVKVTNTTPCRS